jgi:hypothetical protein
MIFNAVCDFLIRFRSLIIYLHNYTTCSGNVASGQLPHILRQLLQRDLSVTRNVEILYNTNAIPSDNLVKLRIHAADALMHQQFYHDKLFV